MINVPPEGSSQTDSTEVSLVCLVSSSVRQNYNITWLEYTSPTKGVVKHPDGVPFPPQKTKHGYLTTSICTTSRQKWDNFTLFECEVRAAGSNQPVNTQTVSKAQGNSIECSK